MSVTVEDCKLTDVNMDMGGDNEGCELFFSNLVEPCGKFSETVKESCLPALV